MAKGEGAHLWDLDGHEYVDFLSEFTAGIYGHSHPVIRQAIAAALEGGLNFGSHNAAEARFAATEPESILLARGGYGPGTESDTYRLSRRALARRGSPRPTNC